MRMLACGTESCVTFRCPVREEIKIMVEHEIPEIAASTCYGWATVLEYPVSCHTACKQVPRFWETGNGRQTQRFCAQ